MLYELFSSVVLLLTLVLAVLPGTFSSSQIGLQQDIISASVDNQNDNEQAAVMDWCQKKNMANKPAECIDKLRQFCDNANNNNNNNNSINNSLIICKSMRNITIVAGVNSSNNNNNNNNMELTTVESSQQSSSMSTVVINMQQPTLPKESTTAGAASGSSKISKGRKRAKKAQKEALKKLKVKLNDRQLKQYNVDKMHLPLNDAMAFKRSKDRRSNPTELDVNDPENHFHGDMDLTEEQLQAISVALDDPTAVQNSGRKKRKVGKPPTFHLWDSFPIAYQFGDSVPAGTREIITKAIKLWEDNTCVRFQKDGTGEDKLEFVNGDGCSSFVGKAGGVQEISLRTPGCNRLGVATHEIGHSLGFFHEQSRPDQKENVKINYPNIQLLRYNNFMPMPWKDVNTYNTPYDYGSVMHYDGLTKGFTYSEDQYSIITVDPLYQHTIGQRNGPSFVDFKQVNLAYCSNKCPQKLGCHHNGYENPNKCSECKCPTGFGGRLCDTVEPSPSRCGEVLTAKSIPQYFTTRNYPNNYTTDEECNWLILAPQPNARIRLEFVDVFSLPCFETCSESYVELKLDGDFQRTGTRLCCDKYPQGQPLLSKSDRAVVLFRSYGESDKGFKLKYWSEGGGGNVTEQVNNTASSLSTTTTSPVVSETDEPGRIFPRTTPKNPAGCQCSEWGTWEACTQPCGGCGVVKRSRWCNRKDCYITEKRHCNYDKCPSGTSFLLNNGEFHILVYGCCFGLLSNSVGKCTGLAAVWNEWIQNAATGNKIK